MSYLSELELELETITSMFEFDIDASTIIVEEGFIDENVIATSKKNSVAGFFSLDNGYQDCTLSRLRLSIGKFRTPYETDDTVKGFSTYTDKEMRSVSIANGLPIGKTNRHEAVYTKEAYSIAYNIDLRKALDYEGVKFQKKNQRERDQ